MDAAHICDWAIYQAVLSAAWTVEDEHTIPIDMLKCIQFLRQTQVSYPMTGH
jgi:streptomycin 6-kinase